jgi:hypothetical protein
MGMRGARLEALGLWGRSVSWALLFILNLSHLPFHHYPLFLSRYSSSSTRHPIVLSVVKATRRVVVRNP